MDTKLKKLNKKLVALILLFLICAGSFTAALTLGITGIIKLENAQISPSDLINSSNYKDSSQLADDYASLLWNIHMNYMEGNLSDKGVVRQHEEWKQSGISFYLADGQKVYTNVPGHSADEKPLTVEELQEIGKSEGEYCIYSDNYTEGESSITDEQWGNMYFYVHNNDESAILTEENDAQIRLYLAFSNAYLDRASEMFDTLKYETTASLIAVAILVGIWISSLIACSVLCGRRDPEGSIVLRGINRWFTEVILAGLALTAVALFAAINHAGYELYYFYRNADTAIRLYHASLDFNNMSIALFSACFLYCSVILLYLFLILVRKGKAGRFFADCMIVRAFRWFIHAVQDLYRSGNPMRKFILIIFGLCLLSSTMFGLPAALLVALAFGSKMVKQYEEIKKGVREIRGGNLAYQIPIEGEMKGEFQMLAADINAISEGFDVAVKQELKNQRMKTELISNVSHDIKTPLTSIITYVDLLKREGLDCEDAPKYLDILDQKSIRLKRLTEDLFEAAKASSGDLPVTMGIVDLMSLLNQTLGELDDRFVNRGLNVILKPENEHFYVNADGQLLWRVLENVFGNAIKYSLENSRVYVDISEETMDGERFTKLEVKNISQNPLNIPEDELMERFKRGDESRSTEGSGLGLSIAKDLTAIQHGQFNIMIDGDLFKVILLLKSANK